MKINFLKNFLSPCDRPINSYQSKKILLVFSIAVPLLFHAHDASAAKTKFYFHQDAATMSGNWLLDTAAPHGASNSTTSDSTSGTDNTVILFKPGVSNSVTATGHAPSSTPRGFGWWSPAPLRGTFGAGAWNFNFQDLDNRANITSHYDTNVWKVPQNNATSGATLLLSNVGSTDFWNGDNVLPGQVVNETSTTVGPFTMNSEYLFVEVWGHTSAGAFAGKVANFIVEGSEQTDADRSTLTTANFTDVWIEQSAYRWFKNRDATSVASSLTTAQDASTTFTGVDFRLRILLHASTTQVTSSTDSFKLQFATSTPGGCDPAYAGETYVDVATSTGDIRFKNNATPADGAALTSNVSDPTHGGDSVVNQTYEESNNFTATSTIATGADGKWDFALTNVSAPDNTTYCFRVAYSSSTLIATSTATKIPEITIQRGITLMWDAATSTLPSGWDCISCTSDDEFFNVMPRASSSYANASTSADTVTHTASSSATGGGASGGFGSGGSTVPGSAHTHSISTFTTGASSTLPPLVNLFFVRAPASTTIPNGMIGMFDVAATSSLPANWSYYSALDARYLRGSSATSTGGSAEHGHSLNASSTAATSSLNVLIGDGAAVAANAHTHGISGTSVNASNTPPFVNIVFAKLSATSSIPNGLLAIMNTTSTTTNWSVVSTSSPYLGNFLRGSNSFGSTGGSATHTHATTTVTSAGPSATDISNSAGSTAASDTHTHNFEVRLSSASSLPVYRDVVIAKFSTPNNAPTVDTVTLNNGSNIVLTPNTTTTVRVNFTVTDTDGCSDVFTSGSVTVVAYRSGVTGGSSCTANLPNCYRSTTSTHSCAGGNSANATTSFDIYYFAEATDATSSFASQQWLGFVKAVDAANASSSATSTTVTDLLTLTAIDVSVTSINYGTQSPSSTTAINQTTTIKNAGNSTTTLKIHGEALTLGANSIATSSQRYATSTFTVGANEQQLQPTATAVSGFSVPPLAPSSWRTTTALPKAMTRHAAVAYNGYLYSVGGTSDGTTATTTVLFAALDAAGTVGSWSAATALPTASLDHTSVAYNNFLYVLGGCNADGCTSATATVRFAPINSTGSLGSWSTTTALPTGRASHAAVAANGYMYVSGGCTQQCGNLGAGGTATTTVYYAPINSTGSLGSWSTTTALTQKTADHQMLFDERNGLAYIFGGRNFNGVDTFTVYANVLYASSSADGTLGSWVAASSLPNAVRDPLAFMGQGAFYSTGGFDDNLSVEYDGSAFANQDNTSGTLSSWASSTVRLPKTLYEHVGGAWNGYAYAAGGVGNSAVTSTVLYTSLNNRSVYWGLTVPLGVATGTYNGQNTFTSVFSN